MEKNNIVFGYDHGTPIVQVNGIDYTPTDQYNNLVARVKSMEMLLKEYKDKEQSKPEKLLNVREEELLESTSIIWNRFLELPMMHPDESGEFRFHIHALQNIILSRTAKKLWPYRFNN